MEYPCDDLDIANQLNWNKYGRALVDSIATVAVPTILAAFETVNQIPRHSQYETPQGTLRPLPEFDNTGITFQILQKVCLPKGLIG